MFLPVLVALFCFHQGSARRVTSGLAAEFSTDIASETHNEADANFLSNSSNIASLGPYCCQLHSQDFNRWCGCDMVLSKPTLKDSICKLLKKKPILQEQDTSRHCQQFEHQPFSLEFARCWLKGNKCVHCTEQSLYDICQLGGAPGPCQKLGEDPDKKAEICGMIQRGEMHPETGLVLTFEYVAKLLVEEKKTKYRCTEQELMGLCEGSRTCPEFQDLSVRDDTTHVSMKAEICNRLRKKAHISKRNKNPVTLEYVEELLQEKWGVTCSQKDIAAICQVAPPAVRLCPELRDRGSPKKLCHNMKCGKTMPDGQDLTYETASQLLAGRGMPCEPDELEKVCGEFKKSNC